MSLKPPCLRSKTLSRPRRRPSAPSYNTAPPTANCPLLLLPRPRRPPRCRQLRPQPRQTRRRPRPQKRSKIPPNPLLTASRLPRCPRHQRSRARSRNPNRHPRWRNHCLNHLCPNPHQLLSLLLRSPGHLRRHPAAWSRSCRPLPWLHNRPHGLPIHRPLWLHLPPGRYIPSAILLRLPQQQHPRPPRCCPEHP